MKSLLYLIGCLTVLPFVLLTTHKAYSGKLTVIYDSGHTLPLDPYKNQHKIQREKELPTLPKASPAIVAFPIATPSLTPGKVNPMAFSMPHLQTPIFIIGNDTLSKTWLAERRNQLLKLHAIGLLVEAKNQQEVEYMIKLGKGLRIIPASGKDIAKQLPITHYPILISKQGLEQ